jgi:iron(III) transport system permease protein
VVVIVAILAVLVLYPLYSVLRTAISGEGWAVFSRLFSTSSNRRVILNTLVLGVVVGVIGTIVGFFLAFLQVRVEMRGKRILHLLALMPIIAPPFAVATSAIVLFGRNGFISEGLFGLTWNIYGLPGLTLVLSLSFFPVAYMNLVGMLRSLDPALDEAASNLGASKPRIFWTVTLPMLIPGLAASFLLLFIESIADLANPLVIGGDYTVLAARAYIAIVGDYNIEAGAAYSLTLLIPALLVFALQRYWVSRKSVVTVTGKPNGRPTLITGPVARRVLAGIGWAFGALVVLVYGTVLAGGFVKSLGIDNTFTLENYRFVLFGLGKKAMVDTTTLALIATPVAGLLGILIAWLVARKLKGSAAVVDFIGMLGLTVPGTVLGIGYLLAFNHPVTVFGVQILPALAGGGAMFSGAIAIIMVYVARSIPAGQRNGIASLEQIGPEIDEASTSLGASGPQTLRKVTLPLIRPATVSGLTYAFARSMTTLSPIIFITTPGVKIMTAQILAEVDVGRYGNAFAYCTILIVLVMMVIGLLNLLVRDPAKVLANLGGS